MGQKPNLYSSPVCKWLKINIILYKKYKICVQNVAVNVAVEEKFVAVKGPKVAVVFDGMAVEPSRHLATLVLLQLSHLGEGGEQGT